MMDFLIRHYVSWHARQVEHSFRHPEATQNITFRRLKKGLRFAELANSSGFINCNSLEELRYLPATDSKKLEPLFDRVFAGGNAERQIFGSSHIVAFARTSGTTAKPKDIPLNRAYMKAQDRSLVRVTASYLFTTRSWSSFLQCRHVILASRPYIEDSPTGLPVVDISGMIPTRTWRAFRWLYIPGFKDLWLPDWKERLKSAIEQSRGKNVTTISALPVMMNAFVKEVRSNHGGAYLDEIWPNLKFYIFGAVPISDKEKLELRKKWFRKGYNHDFHFVEAYFATEACIAHSFDPNQKGLALNLLEYLFLFKEHASDDTSLLAHEIKEGRTYLLYVTTPGGLINYAMGDKIRVVSERPLLIEMVGREKEEISLTGEKVSLEQLRLAVSDLQIAPTDFAVWPENHEEQAGLVWALPEKFLTLLDAQLSKRLDASLSQSNSLYNEALMIEKVINPSRICFIPDEIFETYKKSKQGVGQFKTRQIFRSREDAEAAFKWTFAYDL